MAGTVTATIKLDRKGFVMKEAIPVYAEIKNLSTRRISSTQVSLIQVRFYVLVINQTGLINKEKQEEIF